MTRAIPTREEQTARERAVIARLVEMLHVGYAEVGLADVWELARRGFGRLLVVEENYRGERSRSIGSALVPAGDEHPDALDDPVQAVKDMVRGSGGVVEIVAPDSLKGFDRIGLVTGRGR